MPEEPNKEFAPYFRADGAGYGDPDKLQALSDGYFGLNTIFGINVVLAIGLNALIRSNNQPDIGFAIGGLAIIFVVVVAGTLRFNRLIGRGIGWSSVQPVVASLLMGLNSALCCGIVGYVVMQSIAAKEMKRYGIQAGFFGLKKKDVRARIAELRASPTASGPDFRV